MSDPIVSLSARSLATLLPDLSALPGALYIALTDAVTALIRDGRVAPETRLPSERALAEELRLSRATVSSAYDQLRERGLLASRTGAGSFVTLPDPPGRRSDFARWSVASPETVIDLSCAALSAPEGVLERAISHALGRLGEVTSSDGYNPTGLAPLRAAVARRFTERGVPTGPEQIAVTNGALHAFDLLLRLLVGPGDRVVTELPSYPGAFDAIRANSARVVPVPMSPGGGWDVRQLQASVRQTSPRLAYLIPDFHNPTGCLVDEESRREVFRTARQAGTSVVVDESFVDVGFVAPVRPSAAIDPSVITIGSISKPVWGGLRIGWIRASADLVRRLALLRATTDLAGSALDQLVASGLFPHLDEIAAARRAELLPRRDGLLAALKRELPGWRWVVPDGGLSVWVELDEPLATPLTLAAAHAGVHIVPGSRFGVDGTLERFIRLPFAGPVDELELAVRRLAEVWRRLERSQPAQRPLVVA